MTLIKRSNDLFPSLFEDFFGRDWLNASNQTGTLPAVNLKENDDQFEVELAAPGMNKKDFKIELENNVLTISYEKEYNSDNANENHGKYAYREFNYQSFQRSFTLPNTIESDKINAKYVDGILNLTIPKKEEAKRKASRKIEIK